MANPSRFTFSLLRLMLSIAAMAVVLAIGRRFGSPLEAIAVATAAAGLMMFVIQWRHVPVLLFEAFGALLGIGAGFMLASGVRPPHTGTSDLAYTVGGAFLGWFITCLCVRGGSRAEADRRLHGRQPDTDEIEIRPRNDAGRTPDNAAPTDPYRPDS